MQKSSSSDCRYIVEECEDGYAGIHQVSLIIDNFSALFLILFFILHRNVKKTQNCVWGFPVRTE